MMLKIAGEVSARTVITRDAGESSCAGEGVTGVGGAGVRNLAIPRVCGSEVIVGLPERGRDPATDNHGADVP